MITNKRGLQMGPEIDWTWAGCRVVALAVAVVVAVMTGTVARAGIEDSPDPISGVKGPQVTEDPSPVIGYILIDMRRPQFTFNPQFINPEVPRAIVPMGYGLKIIMPVETDSGCRPSDITKCTAACKGAGKTFAACDLEVEWNADGSATRTRICTCAPTNVTPGDRAYVFGVPGNFVVTHEIRTVDESGEGR